jgi:hypothetical protein
VWIKPEGANLRQGDDLSGPHSFGSSLERSAHR